MNPPELLRIVGPDERPKPRRTSLDSQTLAQARSILDDVEREGEPAVRRHAERLGDLTPGGPLLYAQSDLAAACDRLASDTRGLLERTAERIRIFAAAQRKCLTDLKLPIPGGQAGHTCIPVDVAGCYAPGGRFPLPSSVIMTVVTRAGRRGFDGLGRLAAPRGCGACRCCHRRGRRSSRHRRGPGRRSARVWPGPHSTL